MNQYFIRVQGSKSSYVVVFLYAFVLSFLAWWLVHYIEAPVSLFGLQGPSIDILMYVSMAFSLPSLLVVFLVHGQWRAFRIMVVMSSLLLIAYIGINLYLSSRAPGEILYIVKFFGTQFLWLVGIFGTGMLLRAALHATSRTAQFALLVAPFFLIASLGGFILWSRNVTPIVDVRESDASDDAHAELQREVDANSVTDMIWGIPHLPFAFGWHRAYLGPQDDVVGPQGTPVKFPGNTYTTVTTGLLTEYDVFAYYADAFRNDPTWQGSVTDDQYRVFTAPAADHMLRGSVGGRLKIRQGQLRAIIYSITNISPTPCMDIPGQSPCLPQEYEQRIFISDPVNLNQIPGEALRG